MNQNLPNGVLLQGRDYTYTIVRTLGQGSFGITYLATTQVEGSLGSITVNVALKEFFMKEINGRDGSSVTGGSTTSDGLFERYRQKFRREAQNLSKMHHSGIVKVFESFDANGTTYIAMQYLGGGSLDDYIFRKGKLSEEEALRMTRLIGSALQHMHSAHMLHLDLKPSNIMLNDLDEPVIIDFGLSKQYGDDGNPESSTTVGGGTPGYAPIEQASYHEGKGFPTAIDVYALGATLFKMLCGHRPPEAAEIMNFGFPADDLKDVSEPTLAAVEKAMAFRMADRYTSVQDFLEAISSDDEGHVAADEATTVFDDADEKTQVDFRRSEHQPTIMTVSVGNVNFNMVSVQAGSFVMGCPSEEAECSDAEKPAHRVTLTKNFYLGETTVTQALWKVVMKSNPSQFKGDNMPVENVSYNMALMFIKKLNCLTGLEFRLPTEAEWEFAARGGIYSRHFLYSGSNNVDDVAWYWKNSGDAELPGTDKDWDCDAVKRNNCRTHPVRSMNPNELGFYDMSGNVWEWCADWYGKYSSEDQTDPQGPRSGSRRVYRGGGWRGDGAFCRATFRNGGGPTARNGFLGFRLLLSH